MTKNEVIQKLEELNIKPLKSLGQNFLIDQNIIDRILNHVPLAEYDSIIEIGPGLGSLTEGLQEYKSKVKLIELDKTLASKWKEKGFEVYHQDALKFDWKTHGPQEDERSILISNLPYQISSRLLVDFFCQSKKMDMMILMFQKEVGERLRAIPEDKKLYGLISVLGQLAWDIKTVTKVSRASFYPAPEIESVVLEFKNKDFICEDPKKFVNFLKNLFSSRRKKIGGTLKKMGYSLENLQEVKDKRPDELGAEELFALFSGNS